MASCSRGFHSLRFAPMVRRLPHGQCLQGSSEQHGMRPRSSLLAVHPHDSQRHAHSTRTPTPKTSPSPPPAPARAAAAATPRNLRPFKTSPSITHPSTRLDHLRHLASQPTPTLLYRATKGRAYINSCLALSSTIGAFSWTVFHEFCLTPMDVPALLQAFGAAMALGGAFVAGTVLRNARGHVQAIWAVPVTTATATATATAASASTTTPLAAAAIGAATTGAARLTARTGPGTGPGPGPGPVTDMSTGTGTGTGYPGRPADLVLRLQGKALLPLWRGRVVERRPEEVSTARRVALANKTGQSRMIAVQKAKLDATRQPFLRACERVWSGDYFDRLWMGTPRDKKESVWKLDVKDGWFAEEGRALDSVIGLREDAETERMEQKDWRYIETSGR